VVILLLVLGFFGYRFFFSDDLPKENLCGKTFVGEYIEKNTSNPAKMRSITKRNMLDCRAAASDISLYDGLGSKEDRCGYVMYNLVFTTEMYAHSLNMVGKKQAAGDEIDKSLGFLKKMTCTPNEKVKRGLLDPSLELLQRLHPDYR